MALKSTKCRESHAAVARMKYLGAFPTEARQATDMYKGVAPERYG
jgi:hypothetical protein